MKDFSEFFASLCSEDYGNSISEIVKDAIKKVERDEHVPTSREKDILAAFVIANETTLMLLKRYHQWLHQ